MSLNGGCVGVSREVTTGADRGGGLGGQDPPLFCQLRKKFKIRLNHHYYYDILCK